MVLATGTASAAPITFAQFQQNAPGNPFVFTNSGSGSTFLATSVPINFQYQVPNGYGGVNQNIPAKLTLSALVDSTAFSAFSIVGQPLKQVLLTITANTPVGGNDLLLKIGMDGGGLSTAMLLGELGKKSLGGTADPGLNPAVNFVYNSDFLLIDSSQERNYALSFSSLSSALAINGNGYLNSFKAAGSGTFAGTIVPEPGTAGLVLAGAGILAGFWRRRGRNVQSRGH